MTKLPYDTGPSPEGQATMMDQRRRPLPAGYRLKQYRIEHVLGCGGFGITYLAYDQDLHAKVAIKEYMPAELAVRERGSVVKYLPARHDAYRIGLERFQNEARTLVQFRSNPNIVQVLEVLAAKNTAYIVMAYEEGCCLDAHLTVRGGSLSAAELLPIAWSLLNGLEAVHDKNLLHLDLKPANIFLRQDGNPMLLDFGTARQLVGNQTRTLAAMLTPGYAPIEQYEVNGRLGAWSDIYGLGAVLYTCLTDRLLPEVSARIQARLSNDLDPLAPALTVGRERYPEAFLKAVDWSLGMLFMERPQSVAELRQVMFPEKRIPADPLLINPDQKENRLDKLENHQSSLDTRQVKPADSRKKIDELPPATVTEDPPRDPVHRPKPVIDQGAGSRAPWQAWFMGFLKRKGMRVIGLGLLVIASLGLISVYLGRNSPPVVSQPQLLSVSAGSGPVRLTIAPPSDPDEDPLTITVTEMPNLGHLLLADGSAVDTERLLSVDDLSGLVYLSDPTDPGGPVWFKYKVEDGRGGTANGSVTITVTPNRRPEVGPERSIDVIAYAGPIPLRITPPSDPDKDPLSIMVREVPQSGHLMLADGSAVEPSRALSFEELSGLSYRTDPAASSGTGWFRYSVEDGRGGSAVGSVRITTMPNRPPDVEPGRALSVVYGLNTIPLAIARPVDPEGGPLRLVVNELPTQGTVRSQDRVLQPGQALAVDDLTALTYILQPGQSGTAGAFRYRAEDEGGAAVTGSVTIEVKPSLSRPEVMPDRTLSVPLNTVSMPLDIEPPKDPDGGIPVIQVTQIPSHGIVHDGIRKVRIGDMLVAAQLTELTYQPRPNYDGEAGWFRYSVTNHNGGQIEGGVRIEVAPGALSEDQLQAIEQEFSGEGRQAIQRSLSRLGYYSGPLDGVFGESVAAAIRSFQRVLGHPDTGKLSHGQRRELHERAAAEARSEFAALEAAWNEAERIRVQRGLELLGYFRGSRTGVFDAATREAIRAFQAAVGAPETGFLSTTQRLVLAQQAAEAARRRAEAAAFDAQLAAARNRAGSGQRAGIKYRDGSIYYGDLDARRGVRHGSGIVIGADGQRYEGQWVQDVPSGFGVNHHSDGTRFAGEWNERLPDGYGTMITPTANSRIAGEWAPDLDTAESHVNGYAVLESDSNRSDQRGIWRSNKLIVPLQSP
jgi:serine/threonine protein kinase/peptidoglycan hydrolase-like protein with peptidoglycan-binding domain